MTPTPEDLARWKALAEAYGQDARACRAAAEALPALIAEVERLREREKRAADLFRRVNARTANQWRCVFCDRQNAYPHTHYCDVARLFGFQRAPDPEGYDHEQKILEAIP